MNQTYNFSLVNYNIPNTEFNYSHIIKDVCDKWRGVSTYAHDFYIIFVWIFFIAGFIRRVWDPVLFKDVKYKLFDSENNFIIRNKINIIDLEIQIFKFIQELSTFIIFSRIMYVYYIINIIGG